jgi:hypothetical protein
MFHVLGLTTAAIVFTLLTGCASTDEPPSEDEDPADRVFEPLDNAVDELNRDLNEGNDGKRDER